MIKNYKLRLLLPVRLKRMLRELTYLHIFSDWQSARRFYRLCRGDISGPVSLLDLRVRPLGNRPIRVRTGSADSSVLFSAFAHQFHLPPKGVIPSNDAIIFDLGANIGCTMAHFASLFPQATIHGVELDEDNARLCRVNIAPWNDQCHLRQGAVWSEDGEVQYDRSRNGEDGFSASALGAGTPFVTTKAKALSLNTLIAECCHGDRIIDYVKMDIEGAERPVLRENTEWAARVRCIKVELHGDYTGADCIKDLRKLGFTATQDKHHAACVVGQRPAQSNAKA